MLALNTLGCRLLPLSDTREGRITNCHHKHMGTRLVMDDREYDW